MLSQSSHSLSNPESTLKDKQNQNSYDFSQTLVSSESNDLNKNSTPLEKTKAIAKQTKKRCKVMRITKLFRPIYENKVFFLFGGIMLPSDFSQQLSMFNVIEQNFFKQNIPIENIEKHLNFTQINYFQHTKGIENFSHLIKIYEKKGNKQYYDLAQVLLRLQNRIKIVKEQGEKHLALKMIKSPEIQAEKFHNFMKDMQKIVNSMDQNGFYLFGALEYDYFQKSMFSKNVGLSVGYLSLIGTDQDQFANLSMRYGQPYSRVGEVILQSLIQSLSTLVSGAVTTTKVKSETAIVTLDGFYVPCTEVRNYYIPRNQINNDFIEMGFCIIEYEVSIPTLSQLLTMRAKKYNSKEGNHFERFSEEHFDYTMNSQMFIEKYYPNCISNDYLRCKYREINNEKQQQ